MKVEACEKKKNVKEKKIIRKAYGVERTFLIAQLVKNLPVIQETWVQFLGWEGPLEKEMATHSGILAWRIPWTDQGLQRIGRRLRDEDFHFLF